MTKTPESSEMSYELGLNYYELLKAKTDVKISAIDSVELDDLGIARFEHSSDMAWFQDPSGNILALVEQVLAD